MTASAMQKNNMLVNLLKPASISDASLAQIADAPWASCFQESPYQHLVFADCGVPLQGERVTYTPIEIGHILDALMLKSTDTVLEIGSSGMLLTSILAKACCSVMTVEPNRSVHDADAALCDQLDLRNVQCSLGDASQGWENTTYSVVLVNGALPHLPQALATSLTTQGRLFVTLGRARTKHGTLIWQAQPDVWQKKTLFETEQAYLPCEKPVSFFDF